MMYTMMINAFQVVVIPLSYCTVPVHVLYMCCLSLSELLHGNSDAQGLSFLLYFGDNGTEYLQTK